MHEAGLLRIVFPRMFAIDWRFQERAKIGPGEETLEALRRLWARPELEGLVPELDLPHDGWPAVAVCCKRLSAAGQPRPRLRSWTQPDPGEESWSELARLGEELASEDPVAGTIAVLYAVAAWEGALGAELNDQPWQGHHWGWHIFPAALGRTLLAADAVWTAREVVERALGFVEAAKGFPFDPTLAAVVAEYSGIADRIERRLSACAADLAWDLRASLAPDEGPGFRPEVAAMLWTLGDVPHAELVAADPSYVPPLSVVRSLVEVSMSSLPTDPFLQYLWLELKDRPPLDLRSHKVLFSAINNVYYLTGVHEQESIGLFSPSRTYARAAIEHFAGGVSPGTAEALDEAGGLFHELVGTREPIELFRMDALQNLALRPDGPQRTTEWARLARFATEILDRTVRRSVFRRLHNRLDIPFHYLEDGADAVELHRSAGLGFWLAITRPAPPAAPRAAELLEEEDELLRELRGARFIRLLPELPAHYHRYGFRIDEAFDLPVPDAATELEGGLLRFDPFDRELAKRTLDDAWERLDSLWARMRDVVPAYADERLEPYASADEFRRALAPVLSGHV